MGRRPAHQAEGRMRGDLRSGRTRSAGACARAPPAAAAPSPREWLGTRRGRYLRRRGSRGQSPSQAASESKHGAAWSAQKGSQPVFPARVLFLRLRDLERQATGQLADADSGRARRARLRLLLPGARPSRPVRWAPAARPARRVWGLRAHRAPPLFPPAF